MSKQKQLVLTALADLPMVKEGDRLDELILVGLEGAGIPLEDGDLLVVAQKIVSKSEGRAVQLSEVEPSPNALELAQQSGKDPRLVEVILGESNEVVRVRPGLIIVEHRLGFVCANAGVDASNVDQGQGDRVLMLPENPDRSAELLRRALQEKCAAQIGVVIIDSHGRAWREGTVGISIGIAGMPAVQDLRGKPDLFGATLRVTQVGLADEVAAAASILMGQADEGCPVVHMRGLPYLLREGSLSE
jgi:coenzyme F420-0:L-glutamate ligase / coenzyme F420-1:gamma-L-glutamate ligase